MISRRHLSKIVYAASAALVLGGCTDRLTEPDATSSPDNSGPADAGAVKFWEAGSSVGWNGIGRNFLMARPFNPFLEARVLTYLSLAQYNAIIAAENSTIPGKRPSRAGAAAGASAVVLKDFFPSSADGVVIDDRLAAQKAAPAWPGEEQQDFAAGEAIGRSVGAEVIAYARLDNTGLSSVPTTGPGGWIGTAPVPGLFGTRPLALTSANQFRSLPPPAFDLTVSSPFQIALAEVQALSVSHTADQVALAVFWNNKVARYQNEIATDMIVSHRRSEREAAHILALANMAGFDALIGCWDSKFAYWYIRPWQVDASINFPIGKPNHPSYPSGHSCVTAAYSTVLGQAFPDERPALAANVEAASQSRMNGGLHYRFDLVAGQVLGQQVAELVLRTNVTGHDAIPLD
jgi:membrane-associated phospholipid phosphatase